MERIVTYTDDGARRFTFRVARGCRSEAPVILAPAERIFPVAAGIARRVNATPRKCVDSGRGFGRTRDTGQVRRIDFRIAAACARQPNLSIRS